MQRRGAVAAALVLTVGVAAACEQQVAAGPFGGGGAGAIGGGACEDGCGGLGGSGESGGAGGGGGEVNPWVTVLGSCNPELAVPICFRDRDPASGLQRCVQRGEEWVWESEICEEEFRPGYRTCEDGNPECIREPCEATGNCGTCVDACALGEVVCIERGYDMIGACVPVEYPGGAYPCWDGPATRLEYRPTGECTDGFCVHDTCVPTCNRTACECPIDYEPSCAADGRVYWNACERECAGVGTGQGCVQDEVEAVGETPFLTTAWVVLEPGLALAIPRKDEEWKGYFVDDEAVLLEVEPDGAGFAFQERWRAGMRSGRYLEPDCKGLPDTVEAWCWELGPRGDLDVAALADGWAVSSTDNWDTKLHWVTRERVEFVARLNSWQMGEGTAIEPDGDRALLLQPFRVRTVGIRPDGLLDLRTEETLPYRADPARPSSRTAESIALTKRLADGSYLVASADYYEVVIERVLRDPWRREFLTKLGMRGQSTNEVAWVDTGDVLSVASYGGSVRADKLLHRFRDDVWLDGCAERRATWEIVTDDGIFGGTATADVDADGQSEILWSIGDRLLILGRAPNGFLFVRADATVFEGARLSMPTPLDLDGDGRSEVAFRGHLKTEGMLGLPDRGDPIYRIHTRAPLASDP